MRVAQQVRWHAAQQCVLDRAWRRAGGDAGPVAKAEDCVSTAMVLSPNATLSTTLAVLRPTPGRVSNTSRTGGTCPPWCALNYPDALWRYRRYRQPLAFLARYAASRLGGISSTSFPALKASTAARPISAA